MADPACKESFTTAYMKCQFEILLKAKSRLTGSRQGDPRKKKQSQAQDAFSCLLLAAAKPYVLHRLEDFIYNSIIKYCIVSRNGL